MIRILGLLLLLCTGGFAQNPLTATFPTTLDTEMVFCNQSRAILTAPMTNSTSDLTIPLSAGTVSKFCAPSWVTVDAEVMKVCSKGANSLTVCSGGRAVHGGITNHLAGAAVVTYWDENYSNYQYAIMKAVQNALGLNMVNVLQPNKHILFSADNTYDIGQNSLTRPRDIWVARDIWADNSGNFGSWRIGGMTTSGSTSIALSYATHHGQTLVTTSSSAITINVSSGLGAPFTFSLIQGGTGNATFQAAGGVNLFNPNSQFKTFGQGAIATIICWATDTCMLAGNLQQ